MQFYIFLVITVLLLVKPTVTALFIHNLGAEKLPYGFLLIAVTAILTSVFYNRMVKKFAIKNVAIFTVITFSALFFTLSYILHQETISNWVLYFYYVVLSLFGVLVTSQFWVIANMVFNIREAKRLFGFIGAGAIIGGVLGGYLTSIVANLLGTEYVIFLAASLLLLCLPTIFWIWNTRVNRLNKFIKKKRKKKENSLEGSSFSIVLKSKHLVNLSAVVGVSVLVAKLVDYQFSYMSHKSFPEADELASFFGFWYSSFNIVALLIQLFLTNKLLKRFSLSSNMLLLPLILALGSILFVIVPELWVVIFLKGVDTSFKQSINKASFELSILPIPYETKKQAKPFIDVVVDSIATGISGFMLIFIIDKLAIDPFYISFIVLFFLCIWFILISRIRKSYFNSFRDNIMGVLGTANEDSFTNKNSVASTIEVLSNGTETEILAILGYLKQHQSDVFKPYILKLIHHKANKVKAAAIRDIYNYKHEEVVADIKQLALTSNDDEVIYEAMEYLLAHTSGIEDEVYLGYLNNEKAQIKNSALLCLAKASRYNEELGKKFNLNKRIESQINKFTSPALDNRVEDLAELLLTIGYSGNKKYYYFIEKYLLSDNPLLVTHAIKAAGFTHYEPFIEKLMKFLTDENYHKYAVLALQNYGEEIVHLLFKKDYSEAFSTGTRGYIPEVIQLFKTRESLLVLINLFKSKDVLVRLNVSKAGKNLEAFVKTFKASEKRLNDVFFSECLYYKKTLSAINSLERALGKVEKSGVGSDEIRIRKELLHYLNKQLGYSLETVFNLLSIKYLDVDMEIAYKGITHETEESRINTIEFLSNILQSDLKREFLPLLEYHFLSETDSSLEIESVSETKCLLKILNERGIVTKQLVLQLIPFLNKEPFVKKLNALRSHKNKSIVKLAIKALKN